jgi:RNA polymerase sigma-B factor
VATPKGRAPASRDEAEIERLFAEYRRTRDPELRNQLVSLHENLVRFLAAKFTNRGEPIEDLVQVGSIGLINAIDRFEPERGIRFSTYATPTIVGEIKRYFRDKTWNLKVPRWLQDLNLQVIRANETLTQQLGRSPSIAEIAAHVGTSEDTTLQAMELGHAYETISLDSELAAGGSIAHTLSDAVGETDPSLLNVETYNDVKEAVASLDTREQRIIYLRFFQDMSQTEVAKRLGISQMHVSRLQQKALTRLKELLTDQGNEEDPAA